MEYTIYIHVPITGLTQFMVNIVLLRFP